jgi:glycosyltransferase involved in cell wall biosynthesis
VIEDGVTGLLVEPGDAGALADAIVRLVEDRDSRERLGRAARQVAIERYSWRTNAERVVRAYSTVFLSD